MIKRWLCCGAVRLFLVLGCAAMPEHGALAPLPPMGWNSYDVFGSSVTEAEVLENAAYMAEHLKPFGYEYVVVDYRWADATAADYKPNGIGGPLVADAFGRLMPATNRFPSAVDGAGFKPLAEQVHGMGLKFGLHVMRGIPRQAVRDNQPILDSSFHARDAANTNSFCRWCKDMWGIEPGSQAGQDYYDSIFRLYASWGVDYVKVDDLSFPYHKGEIEMVRRAINRCGRPMVLSTSPGATPVQEAAHIAEHANLWRISKDFWDKWPLLNKHFDLMYAWQQTGITGPGRWPDGDMIPLGRIGIRCHGGDRQTRFTKDEQVMLMTILAVMPSPLMLGMHMPDNDEWTTGLLTNRGMLAINQDPLGLAARRVRKEGDIEVWIKDLADGSQAIALFNRGSMAADVTLAPSDGVSSEAGITDVWSGKKIESIGAPFAVPSHGARLLRTLSGRRLR